MPIFALSSRPDPLSPRGSEETGVNVPISIINGDTIIQQSLTVELVVFVSGDDNISATAGT